MHNDGDDSDSSVVVNDSLVINVALLGTYTWSNSYTNSHGYKINFKITLVLNEDTTAAYEATKETYTF